MLLIVCGVLIAVSVVYLVVNRDQFQLSVQEFMNRLEGAKGGAGTKASSSSPPEDFKPGRRQGRHDGVEYTYTYRGPADKGSRLLISVPCAAPGDFKIMKENIIDRIFKKWGICAEVTTGDSTFDDRFFINTKTQAFAKIFFAQSRNRKNVTGIFDKKFGIIECDGKKITAYSSPFFRPDRDIEKTIADTAAQLIEMTKNVPLAPKPDESETRAWKLKRAVVFILPWLLYLTIFFLHRGSMSPIPADGVKIFLYTFLFIVSVWFLYLWLAIKLLKGRSNSHKEFLAAAGLSLLLLIAFGQGITEYINAHFDKSPPATHETLVLDKDRTGSERNTYFIKVKSWRGNGTERIVTDAGIYEKVAPGKTRVTITTKAGLLGCEWVVRMAIAPGDGSSEKH